MAVSLKSLGDHGPFLLKIGLHANAIPLDWTAMLVYADWLQERNEGDPRAAFWRGTGLSLYGPMIYANDEWTIFNAETYPVSWLSSSRWQYEVPGKMFDHLGGQCRLRGTPIPHGNSSWRAWRDFTTRCAAFIAACTAYCETDDGTRLEFDDYLRRKTPK